MTNPQNEESNLLKSFADQVGDVPLLNRPHDGINAEFPLTGYRDQTDDRGVNNKDAAIEFLASLDAIPKNEEGKFDVFLLNNIPVPEGSGAPLEMFRRGLLELGTEAFLKNTYPEWVGDATDDANMELEAIGHLHSLKEYGYEKLNADLNAEPAVDDDGDEEYAEDNILYLSFSMIANELMTLMTGRAETKRLTEEQKRQTHDQYMAIHSDAIDWARETYGLDLHWEPSETQGIYTTFYVESDGLTGYIIWNNPFRIAVKKVRPSTDVSFWGGEGYKSFDYITTDGKGNPSTYPEPNSSTQY